MGNLGPKGDLAAAELAFYSPALLIGCFVAFRQGFSRGWFYIITLCILRILGASMLLYVITQHDDSEGLIITASITSAIGTTPLLLTLQSLLQRMHKGMNSRRDGLAGGGFDGRVWQGLRIVNIAALALAVAGGVLEANSNQGSSDMKTGKDLFEAGGVIFLVYFLVLAGITILTFHRRQHVVAAEKVMLRVGLASLPFLMVRLVFTMLVSFAGPSSQFYFEGVNVWAESFMLFLMEAIVICFFGFAGLVTPKETDYAAQDQLYDDPKE